MHSGSWVYVKSIKLHVQEDLILKSIKISNNVIISTPFHSFSSPLTIALMVNAVALKNTNNRPAYLWWSSALMKREVLLVESNDTVPKNGTVAWIGSIRDRNVVPMWAAVPFGERCVTFRKTATKESTELSLLSSPQSPLFFRSAPRTRTLATAKAEVRESRTSSSSAHSQKF